MAADKVDEEFWRREKECGVTRVEWDGSALAEEA